MTLTLKTISAKRSVFSWRTGVAVTWLLLFTILAFLPITENAINAFPENSFLPPFQELKNWLGTDQLGRNVFWYLISSTRTAWFLTFPPLVGATIVGILVGTLSAYFAKKPLQVHVVPFITLVVFCIVVGAFAIVYVYWVIPSHNAERPFWLLALTVILGLLLVHFVSKKYFLAKGFNRNKIHLPLDEMLQRLLDLWTTFPKLLLLLLLSALAPPSLLSMGIWILVTYWVFSARITRTLVLQIKNEPFYEAGLALGTPTHQLLMKYLWPSMKGQLITNFCFNASGLLGIGSTLAFLGIGLPADVPSWGKMLALARYSVESWWLLIFPALLLLGSILSLQSLGSFFTNDKG